MASFNDKSEIIESINTFKALFNKASEYSQRPKTNYDSLLKNNDNILGFLLALITLLIGVDGLNKLLGRVLNKVVPKFQENLKKFLAKTFQKKKNAEKKIDETPLSKTGIIISIKKIFKKNELKNKPKKNESALFQRFREAFQTGNKIAINDNIFVEYNELTGNLIFTSIAIKTVYELFIDDLLSFIQIEPKNILEQVLDVIFGINSTEKSITDIQKQLEIDLYIDLVIDKVERNITKFDFEKISQEAKIRKQGKTQIDLNCSLVSFGLNETDIEVLLDKDFDLLTDEELGTEILNIVTNGLNDVGLDDDENLKTYFYDSFFKKILNILVGTLVSPEFLSVTALMNSLTNTNFDTLVNDDYKQDLNGELVECIIEDLKELIYNEIYEILKSKIIPLVKGVIEVYLTEQADNYLAILKGLIKL